MYQVILKLHARVQWRGDGAIVVESEVDEVRHLRGEGLLLMPSAFVWPAVTAIIEPPWQPTIFYPARGIDRLWSQAAAPADTLTRLLGHSRALILAPWTIQSRRPPSTTRTRGDDVGGRAATT